MADVFEVVHDLEQALTALGYLHECATEGFPNPRAERRVLWAASSTVNLIRQRIELLRRSIEGEVNPRLLASPNNVPMLNADTEDVVLPEWDAKKRLVKAKTDLDRAQRQLKQQPKRRKR